MLLDQTCPFFEYSSPPQTPNMHPSIVNCVQPPPHDAIIPEDQRDVYAFLVETANCFVNNRDLSPEKSVSPAFGPMATDLASLVFDSFILPSAKDHLPITPIIPSSRPAGCGTNTRSICRWSVSGGKTCPPCSFYLQAKGIKSRWSGRGSVSRIRRLKKEERARLKSKQ